jgi:hypothetical protein
VNTMRRCNVDTKIRGEGGWMVVAPEVVGKEVLWYSNVCALLSQSSLSDAHSLISVNVHSSQHP